MSVKLIGSQVFLSVMATFQAICDDVMSFVMSSGRRNRGWWDDVQALDRRPLIRGLAASGAVR